MAAHLRSAARFRSALDLLATAAEEAGEAGRGDLQARIMGLEGNVRARMGQATRGWRWSGERFPLPWNRIMREPPPRSTNDSPTRWSTQKTMLARKIPT